LGASARFVAILPRLAIAGRQLFFAEAPGPTDDQVAPQIRKTAGALWTLYAGISVAEVLALQLAGMPLYDAVCHAMTTLAAGGFSPHPQSIMGYSSPAVEWIITGFMFLAGANFVLQFRALRGRPRALLNDDEFRAYAGIVLVASALVTLCLWRDGIGPGEALRQAAFQVVSILTTTGFASVDFARWSPQALAVLLALMFIGGCAGSAGGGPKVVRLLLILRHAGQELRRALHPRGVLPVKLNGTIVPDEVMRAILVFFLLYLLVFAVVSVLVIGLGLDLVSGITATIACLGNVGPGFGVVGPMGSFAGLHPVSKVILTLAMWVGRLEIITVLVIIRPEAWRSARWR
jgi:trk system potassium uptake protein TrkH